MFAVFVKLDFFFNRVNLVSLTADHIIHVCTEYGVHVFIHLLAAIPCRRSIFNMFISMFAQSQTHFLPGQADKKYSDFGSIRVLSASDPDSAPVVP